MGCTPSSPNNNLLNRKACTCQCHKDLSQGPMKPSTMSGTTVTQNGGGQPQDIVFKEDPRIPLTGRQIYLIKRSWKGISRNMSATGINMFLSLFEKNESLIRFFSGLQSYRTLAELRASSVLEQHVSGVMLTVDEAITNLDDADYVLSMLRNVGQTHIRFQGFDPNVFLLLKEPFLLAVRDTLGDRFSASMEDIYGKAVTFILSTLVEGFKQAAAAAAADGAAAKGGGAGGGRGGGGSQQLPPAAEPNAKVPGPPPALLEEKKQQELLMPALGEKNGVAKYGGSGDGDVPVNINKPGGDGREE
ncbi:uncharacterized protein LOC143296596 [Babylonia areolata]|uniref:uncharacterized protein LOC143296596 n=1 Tax=Babylonia areolata TaxID=304850 RepID=UPI003FCF7622